MSKKIMIGGRHEYTIQYGEGTAMAVLDKIIEWMEDKNHSAAHSGEGIGQDDNCQTDSVELICDIVDELLIPECEQEDSF